MANDKKGVGQPKKIPNPETLYKWFEEYKKESRDNPIEKMDFKGKDADKVTYKLERPLSWVAFKVYLYKNYSIGGSTLEDYKANKGEIYAEYSDILHVIGDEIYSHQYDGATVGIFAANIIARALGLVEKSETKTEVTLKETRVGFDPDPEIDEKCIRL